ncbi:hypothetical protein Esti_001949 [Eimeria stiedai]
MLIRSLPETRGKCSSNDRFSVPNLSSISSPFASYSSSLHSPSVQSSSNHKRQPKATSSASCRDTAKKGNPTDPAPHLGQTALDEVSASGEAVGADNNQTYAEGPAGTPPQQVRLLRPKRRLIGYCQLSGQALYDAGDGRESIYPFEEMDVVCSKKQRGHPKQK